MKDSNFEGLYLATKNVHQPSGIQKEPLFYKYMIDTFCIIYAQDLAMNMPAHLDYKNAIC